MNKISIFFICLLLFVSCNKQSFSIYNDNNHNTIEVISNSTSAYKNYIKDNVSIYLGFEKFSGTNIQPINIDIINTKSFTNLVIHKFEFTSLNMHMKELDSKTVKINKKFSLNPEYVSEVFYEDNTKIIEGYNSYISFENSNIKVNLNKIFRDVNYPNNDYFKLKARIYFSINDEEYIQDVYYLVYIDKMVYYFGIG